MTINKLLGASIISFTLVGGGCFNQLNGVEVGDMAIDQLITFGEFDETQVSTGMPVEDSAASIFTTSTLFSQAEECGYARDLSYYEDLINNLQNAKAQIYYFEATPPENYQSNGWMITAIPNVFSYKTLAEFKKDFDICAVGGGLYPLDLNTNTLLFTSSCGSGYADDTGRENGCEVVSEIVGPTIKIK